jgi:heme A synthase
MTTEILPIQQKPGQPWRNWLAAILLGGIALGGWVVPLVLEARPPKAPPVQAVDPHARAEALARRELVALLQLKRRTGFEHPDWKTALSNYRRLLHVMGKSDAEIETTVRRLLESAS